MPYLEDNTTQDAAVERQRRRWAITGTPESGKTTSLLTFPRPCAIVSCPDELGFGSIPKHLHPIVDNRTTDCSPACPRWQLDIYIFGAVNAEKPDWIGTCEETRRLMADLLTGKKGWKPPTASEFEGTSDSESGKGATLGGASHGPDLPTSSRNAGSSLLNKGEQAGQSLRYKTVAVDGWHKLYPIYLNMFTGGALAKGEEFDGRRIYPKSNAVFFGDGRRWCQSDVEWLVFTMWVDRDTDDPNTQNATSHFYPSLSGKAGQNVVGEIGITLVSLRQGTGPGAKYIWQTLPDNRYWGVGCHLPPDLAKKLPASVPQDWKALVPFLGLAP